jgi:hypothetical protein
MNIYVAASWRTPRQQEVVQALQNAGHEVYDFKNPSPGNKGFHWSEIDASWKEWTPGEYRDALHNTLAVEGFKNDYIAMQEASVFVGVQPFGRSASMEMGWAAGQEKHTILLLDQGEPELMVKLFDHICLSIPEVLTVLQSISTPGTRDFR